MPQTVRSGRYRHFKGKEYEALFTATHSETMEPTVVHRALYGEHGPWVCPASMWEGPDEREGEKIPRFIRIEEDAT